jgi:amidase
MINPHALDEARDADKRLQAYLRKKQPYSPLLGIPVLIKDNIDATPMPTTAGSVALARSFPAVDAPLVVQLRAAGAVIIAKGSG